MMSVSNAYIRAANFHFKNLKDKSADEFDTEVVCTLVGRATRWELPPPDVVEFLFGEWWFVLSYKFQCLSMGVRARGGCENDFSTWRWLLLSELACIARSITAITMWG